MLANILHWLGVWAGGADPEDWKIVGDPLELLEPSLHLEHGSATGPYHGLRALAGPTFGPGVRPPEESWWRRWACWLI